RIQTALIGLGLKAVAARIESLPGQASKTEPSYRAICRPLAAGAPFVKTFDQFDGFQPRCWPRERTATNAVLGAAARFSRRRAKKRISAQPLRKLRFSPAPDLILRPRRAPSATVTRKSPVPRSFH